MHLYVFAFTRFALLAIGAIIVTFTILSGVVIEKAVRTDTDGASAVDAFFSFCTFGIALCIGIFFLADLIDADFIIRAFAARILRIGLAYVINADFIYVAFAARILRIGFAGVVYADLMFVAFAARILRLGFAGVIDAGLMFGAFAARIVRIEADAIDACLLGGTFITCIAARRGVFASLDVQERTKDHSKCALTVKP